VPSGQLGRGIVTSDETARREGRGLLAFPLKGLKHEVEPSDKIATVPCLVCIYLRSVKPG